MFGSGTPHLRAGEPNRAATASGHPFGAAVASVAFAVLKWLRHGPDAVDVQTHTADAAPTRDSLIVGNLPLVGHVVAEIMSKVPSHVDRDDLAGAGVEGLVQAADTWRPGTGVPFGAFARTRVRGAMVDELRRVDWASRGARSRARTAAETTERLAAGLGRVPQVHEIADAMGVAPAEVHAVRAETHRSWVRSLSEPIGAAADGTPATAEDTLVDGGLTPEEHTVLAERIGALRHAVELLPERVREAVRGHYFDDEPMADIAGRLGVTESRVSQLRAEGIELLRAAMAAGGGQEEPVRETAVLGVPRQMSRREAAYVASVASSACARSNVSLGSAVLAAQQLGGLTTRAAATG